MPDIYHDIPIHTDSKSLFDCVSTSEGLAKWWSNGGTGIPGVGEKFTFDFGPGFLWKAVVEEFDQDRVFTIKMVESDTDWNGTVIRFEVEGNGDSRNLRFEHLGWPEKNDHYRSSSYCWAMYLRCLKNYLEKGIVLDYENRLSGD